MKWLWIIAGRLLGCVHVYGGCFIFHIMVDISVCICICVNETQRSLVGVKYRLCFFVEVFGCVIN